MKAARLPAPVLIAMALMAEGVFVQSQVNRTAAFIPDEQTISGIHAALAAGTVTCVQVVQAHLRRIDAYDRRGPALNAIIAINPRALELAAALDRLG